jgi:hypothetical protein
MNMPNLLEGLDYKDLKGKKTEVTPINSVYSTYNYGLFSLMEGNRNLNEKNLAKLEASFIKKHLIIPIQVNSDYKIIDGQHRFTVAQKLNLPIYFIINEDYGLDEVELCNTSGVLWKNEDFLNKFIIQKHPVYLDFMNLLEKYNLNITDLLKLFSHYQNQSEKHLHAQFIQGTLSDVGSEEVIFFLESLNLFKDFVFKNTKPFVRAFFRLYTHPRFSLEKMEKQYANRSHMLQKRSTIDDYLYLLATEIYSYGLGKNLLHYDVKSKRFY